MPSKKPVRLRRLALYASITGMLAMTIPAHAQENYPNKPIRLVLGFSAGGGTDAIARGIAQKMGELLGTNVIVDNRPGANGNIAAELVARAPADGYTLLYNTSSVVLSPGLYKKLSYDVTKDLVPVSITANLPIIIVASPKTSIKNAQELVSNLKAQPGKLNYGSAGNGNITHLSTLLFLRDVGATANHVPYKGEAPAVTDVVGGQVDFYAGTAPGVIPLIKAKKLTPIGIATLKRMETVPDVPTLNETVAKGLELGAWSGIMAPAGTKPEIINKLNGAIQKALHDKDLLARFASLGAEPKYGTPAEYGAFLQSELARWTKIIKDNNVHLD